MLEIRDLHPTLAREVVGLRLWERLDDAAVADLRALYAQHGVVVFRRQALSDAELAAFCARLGALEPAERRDWASPTTPEVTVLSNLRDGLGRPVGGLLGDEQQWQTDQSYALAPATGAALYALELPPEGGETFWVDLRAAYAGLSRQLRAKISGKRGIFDYAKRASEAGQPQSEGAGRPMPPVTHALVRAHPETGDRSLYLDPTTTIGIDYMDIASGLALLDELYESATRDEFIYTHRWRVGDLVLWDNGITMHRRAAFAPGARCLMKRMTMRLDRYRHVLPDGRLAHSEIGMPI